MRKNLSLLAFIMLTTLMFVRCADEQVDQYDDDTDIQFMAAAQWKCGRTMAGRADAEPIAIGEGDYPQLLHITVGDGASKQRPASHPANFIIGKTLDGNDNNPSFTDYHDQYRVEKVRFEVSGLHAVLDEGNSTKELRSLYSKGILTGLRVEANTLSPRFDGSTQAKIPQAWDNHDISTIGCIDHLTTKEAFGGNTYIDGKHLFLTLGHVSAMLRLHFAVSEDYSAVRYIDLKSVSINGTPIIMTDGSHILSTTPSPICAAYIKPSHDYKGQHITAIHTRPLTADYTPWTDAVSTTTPLTIKCTYDVYDKDGAIDGHITRPNVTATNTVTLSSLLNATAPVTQIRAGYYYDLYITINPDYLYVLSDHDNKHLIVN